MLAHNIRLLATAPMNADAKLYINSNFNRKPFIVTGRLLKPLTTPTEKGMRGQFILKLHFKLYPKTVYYTYTRITFNRCMHILLYK